MRIEVTFSETGRARLADARRAAGRALAVGDVIDGAVLTTGGVARARIGLMLKSSGRGAHVVFRCPACEGPCAVLFPTPGATLACARCSRHRTRHQRESSRVEWESCDIALEDRLLRALKKKNYTPGGLKRLRRMAEEISVGDEDRLVAALSIAQDALLLGADEERRGDAALNHLLVGMFLKAI